MCVCACVRGCARVHACVRARARARACVCVCVCECLERDSGLGVGAYLVHLFLNILEITGIFQNIIRAVITMLMCLMIQCIVFKLL